MGGAAGRGRSAKPIGRGLGLKIADVGYELPLLEQELAAGQVFMPSL